ncbi:hypothetical protein [Kutzneria kofuensis]
MSSLRTASDTGRYESAQTSQRSCVSTTSGFSSRRRFVSRV